MSIETVADVVEWMRGYAAGFNLYLRTSMTFNDWLLLCDRIEAAAKHDATKSCCETIEKAGPFYDAESVGNSVKLREALKKILRKAEKLQGIDPLDHMTMAGGLSIICALARPALAEPARNCDVGTVKEQRDRVRGFCRRRELGSLEASSYCAHECSCGNNYDCKLAWAQMPCKESEAAK